MKLFIDTNIFIEYFERRLQFDSVRLLFNALEDGMHTGYISVGSFYTIAYIVDQGFKKKGLNRLERVELVRSVLLQILDFTTILELNNEALRNSIKNLSFTDLEDSFQHQAALSGDCDMLITLNTKDFKETDSSFIKVVTPQQFVEEYL